MPPDTERVERSAGAVRRATTRLNRRLRAEGPREGLASTKLSVLGLLRRAGAPMTPGELAAADGVQPQSLTRVLAELEASGLVARCRDTGDTRGSSRSRSPTRASATLAADMHERDAWLAQAMVLELSPTERKVLILAADLMERISDLDRDFVSAEVDAASPRSAAIPVLPMQDAAATVGFYQRIGFRNGRGGDDGYVMLEREGVELHFTLTPDVDPFATAGMARLSVPDADAFRDEILGGRVLRERPRRRPAHALGENAQPRACRSDRRPALSGEGVRAVRSDEQLGARRTSDRIQSPPFRAPGRLHAGGYIVSA